MKPNVFTTIAWIWLGLAAFTAEGATVQRYDYTSYLTRALVECEPADSGWCDTAVDSLTEFRGELYWSGWGATMSVRVCWAGTDLDCITEQLELLFRYVDVGPDHVVDFIRSFDLYDTRGPDLHHHILNWTAEQQLVVSTLQDGRRYILEFASE